MAVLTHRPENKGFGIYRATVVENVDPEGRGRIRFRMDHPNSTPIDKLPFAEYCSPFGGGDNIDGAGFFFVPEIGSQVWIMYENGDKSQPVWLGSSFFSERGRQNIPIEAKPTTVEPTVRMIKTPTGHKLIFDDRPVNAVGDPDAGVILQYRDGTELRLQDGSGSGRGIRLGFGTTRGELKITREGLRLQSNRGGGLVVNDTLDYVQVSDQETKSHLTLMQKKICLFAESGIMIDTPSSTVFNTDKGLQIKSSGGKFDVKSSNVGITSAQDINLQTGGNFNVNSREFQFVGQLNSNFTVDLPIPGVPGLGGNIFINTSGGGILLKNGLSTPGPKITPATFTSNELLMPANAGRLAIGDTATGNALLEGRLGGIFISGVPQILPGTAGGLGGRLPVPLAPLVPTGAPGAPQPAVLGGNLFQLLSQLYLSLNIFLTQLTTAAPAFSTGSMGPNILGPAALAAIAALQASLTAQQNLFFAPAPVPTNILSSYVFVDG